MGTFKQINKNENEVKNEKVGRGNTETRIKKIRSKKVLLNLTDDEYAVLQENANRLGMSCNVYCRFKIFNS